MQYFMNIVIIIHEFRQIIKAVNKGNILKVFGLTTCVQCAVKLGFAPAPHNTYNIYLMTSLLRK